MIKKFILCLGTSTTVKKMAPKYQLTVNFINFVLWIDAFFVVGEMFGLRDWLISQTVLLPTEIKKLFLSGLIKW